MGWSRYCCLAVLPTLPVCALQVDKAMTNAMFDSKYLLMLKHLGLAEKACENVALHLQKLGDFAVDNSLGSDVCRVFTLYEGCAASVHMLLKGMREQLENANEPVPVDQLCRTVSFP